MSLDIDKELAICAAATPAAWEWWTSNSQVRLSSGMADGKVAYADRGHDGCHTIVISEKDAEFIAAARIGYPAALVRLRATLKRLKKINEIIIACDLSRREWLQIEGCDFADILEIQQLSSGADA